MVNIGGLVPADHLLWQTDTAVDLVLNDRTLAWEEMEASCPFCGDYGPGKYHLSLNTRINVYRCNLCGARGNSVSLYANMEGVSNRQAYRALSEDGHFYRFPEQPLSQKPPEREPSSLAARHDTYYDMLTHLELSPKHKADLLARGLSEERITQNMYRSLPRGDKPRRFLAGMLADFHELDGIPGFYVDDNGYWNIAGYSGLLVPYCDKDGYIQGMQVRLDDENKPDRKYRWLSSRTRKFGTRSLSWIYVTGNIHAKTTYLTEGVLKGDVASLLDSDTLLLCFAGVNAIGGLKKSIQNFDISEVAMDMDKQVNWWVRNAMETLSELVRSIPSIAVRWMNWNATFKGGRFRQGPQLCSQQRSEHSGHEIEFHLGEIPLEYPLAKTGETISGGCENTVHCDCRLARLAVLFFHQIVYSKMVDYLKKALIYGHTSRISS